MQRLGIIGGTFDPIHIGHLLLGLFVLEKIPLDEVLFVPAADPPHKEGTLAPAEDRWAMVELAIEGFAGFRASRLELERPGKSYTVDTLRQVRASHPDSHLYLIIGADNLAQMPAWHDPQGILELCTVVAGSRRSGLPLADSALADRLLLIDTPLIELSSTQIRQRLAQGRPIRYMVPEPVEAYIRRKGLYASP
jgi:nicotinate-nucleotide adenylyltransferase